MIVCDAGAHIRSHWVPACAGMTNDCLRRRSSLRSAWVPAFAGMTMLWNKWIIVEICFFCYSMHLMKSGGCVYIMTNKRNGTLYIGSTSDVIGRVFEHKTKVYPKSFTAKHNLNKLVYVEWYDSLENMVARERQLKEWNRNWKIRLIIKQNPNWKDLYDDILAEYGFAPFKQ